ncbi:hypothetical protein KPL71_015788 [Citrus sinensis]|uniref:Uncharacterized protein n=1 Tax=Citrus sinensis TaxID=2711 RepID=A0ACB8KM93_CITSI|nr:hypothetical protein KPL71_015788 [Citrus sinensis]
MSQSKMVPKRPFDDDGFGVLVPEPRKRPTLKKVVVDVMKGNWQNKMVASLEPCIRRVVREELERVLLPLFHPGARSSFNQAETSEVRGLQLLFVNKLPCPIYTGSRIEAEDGGPVKIVLVDPISKTRVTSGPYSSMKVEILVLNGDFGSDDHENWTEREFLEKIVREREGKRPLVTGELHITLKDGVGILSDIVFTDNSSWIRCRKFRLGARVLQKGCREVRIKEAKSEAFVVKDHRGELNKKHYPPSLDDDIWRLEKIAKEGKYHERLAKKGVHTVKDFLRMHTTDPGSLCKIISASNKTWETIVEHAATCVVNDGKLFAFTGDGIILLLNSIYKLVAVTFDGENCVHPNDLAFPQKISVENLKRVAYKNVNQFVLIDARANFGPLMPSPNQQDEALSSPTSILQNHEFPFAHQEVQFGLDHASTSTSYSQEAVADDHQSHPIQNSLTVGDFPPVPGNGNGGNNWCPSCPQLVPSNHLAVEMPQLQMPGWSPYNAIWEQSNGIFFAPSSDSNFGVHISRIGKPKAAWCKIRAAVILESVRRDLAARKMASRPFYINMNY